MSYSLGQNYQFRYTLGVALIIHGLLIFGITVGSVVSATAPHNSSMEVTLALQPADQAPETADFLAAQNQLASGQSDTQNELTTTQQALIPDSTVNPVDQLTLPSSSHSDRPVKPYRIITTAAKTAWSIAVDRELTNDLNEPENIYEDQSLAELSLAIASLEARLAEKQQPDSKKPRTLRLTSTSALASENADYVRQWRNRVETVGNLYYPQSARDRQLYGDVRLLVGIQASGVVDQITVRSSSGQAILDKAAIESIQLASPFEPFPPSLAARYDRIEVIRTWQFRKDRLSAEAL